MPARAPLAATVVSALLASLVAVVSGLGCARTSRSTQRVGTALDAATSTGAQTGGSGAARQDAGNLDAHNPDAAGPVVARIVTAGDIACDGCAQAATADVIDKLIATRNVGAVLPLGDQAYASGLMSEFQAYYAPAWGRPEILAITHPVAGNHEYATGSATGYFDYFDGSGNQMGSAGPRGDGYYSFDFAGWHFIALNSSDACRWVSCAAGSPQVQWLLADLAAHPAACTVAYWHHPRFQAGSTSGELSDAAPLWNALYDAGVDIVLNGHEHGYQQLSPLDKNGQIDVARGIRTFVVGTGGGDYDTTFGGPRLPALEASLIRTHGVLELSLRANGYDWQFVGADGSRPTAASGSAACH